MCGKIIVVLVLSLDLVNAANAELVGWWKLDETSGTTAADSSGNGNYGRLVGTAQWESIGRVGGALCFDGSTGYLRIPHSDALKLINQGDYTITMWFRQDVITLANLLQQTDVNGTGRTLLLVDSATGIQAFLGGTTTVSGVVQRVETWYHVAMIVTEGGTADTIEFYINGAPEGTPAQVNSEDCEGDYLIGTDKGLNGRWLTGLVDDLRFYNHALSEAEILELAVGPRASKPNPANGAIHSETSVELSWLAGPTAISHDVYFGTNEAAVTNADRNWPEYKGNQTGITYPTSGLAEDTTYYWRIDEHNSDGMVTKGDVWSFSTTRVGVLWLDSTETIVAQPPGGAFYPRLLELTNGDWLCAYDSKISKSTDKGATWSYLSMVSFGAGKPGNAQLIQLPNGNLLCAYRLVNEPTKTLKVSRSGNNGRSWHHLSTIISNTEGVWEPHIIQKDDGQLLVFYAQEGGVGGNDQIIEMQRSDDNGATWYSPQTVSRQVGSRDGMPVPVILENGDIVVVLEGHNVMKDYQFVILSVRSSDGGDTWGSRKLVYAPADMNHFAGAPYVVQMPTGEIVASFQTNEVPPGSKELEMGIVMSLDNGNTWISQPRPFSNEFGGHFMWNSLFVQDAHTIVAATTCWGKIKIKKGILYIQSPSPADGTTGVTQMPTLRWNAGDTDLQYDVYFGTDHTAVANANTTTPDIYRGRQSLTSYAPPEELEAGLTYYWRIDEHNSDGTVTKGDVWSFSGYEDFSSSVYEDFETGDFDRFDWRSLGDADWTVTSDEYKSGTYSAQAGPIGNNGSTTLQLTLDCVSGEISLHYKVSSEQGYDYLRFYIDGSLQDEWSGNEDWTQVTYPVTAGTRTFEWTYSKDGSSSDGSDTAWIDNIEFPI